MAKKTVGISIDERLLEKAKAKIPNLSKFFEYCLKNYLGEIQGLVPIWNQQELIDTIAKCQLELYLMNEKGNIEEKRKEAEIEQINFAWRKLFKEYRDRRRINPKNLNETAEILGVTPQHLMDIVDVTHAYCYRDQIDNSNWFEVFEKYG